VLDLLVDGRGDATGVLGDLLALLSLPGVDLLEGVSDPTAWAGSVSVEPSERSVAGFERVIHDQALRRADLGED